MSDATLTTITLLAALTGFVIGALARQSELRRLLAVHRQQHDNFLRAMNLCAEQAAVNAELRKINHGLGRALQDAGISVGVIGDEGCKECEEVEVEWPEEL